MKLPEQFKENMKKMLSVNEFNSFINSYEEERYTGIRINTLKIDKERFKEISPFKTTQIPWCNTGFYIDNNQTPGKHPYYYAGLYYIQEPSAMFPGAVIDASKEDRVLDLCAAPGGKSVQIATSMQNKGVLVSNDISPKRTRALIKNIEMAGIKNAVVTCESPQNLSKVFEGYFTKILIDAPCSGEGMFRKDSDAVKSWNNFKSETCSNIQKEILEQADKMLVDGGTIVYSTCTFNADENEKIISWFLNNYKNYELVPINKTGGIENAREEWGDRGINLDYAARLWPHKLKGEGHFTAKLVKKGQLEKVNCFDDIDKSNIEELDKFVYENLKEIEFNNTALLKDKIVIPAIAPYMLNGIRVMKNGAFIGDVKKGKFIPSHSFILLLNKNNFKNTISFSADSKDIISYLKGETIMKSEKKGYIAVCVDEFPIGFGKSNGDIIKNLYPAGWRKLR